MIADMCIRLNLSRHCIQSEIRRLYERTLSAYFDPVADKPLLEQRLELLQTAMNTLDFSRLRSQYPPLAGGFGQRIELTHDGHRGVAVHIDGQKVQC